MPIDASIPLQGIRPHIMTPAEGLQIQQVAMQVQQQQANVEKARRVSQVVQEPGMFDESGAPSTMAIQKIMAVDPQLGTHFLTARGMALDQQRKMETAKLVAQSKKAAMAAKQKNDDALAEERLTKAQKDKRALFKGFNTDVDEAALAAYDASVKRGEPQEESVRKMRQARMDAFEMGVSSGAVRAVGYNDQMIEIARGKIAGDFDPEEIRERVKTHKMREQEQKAALDDPFKSRKLGQGDRSLDIRTIGQGIKASQVDRKLDIDEDKLDAKIAADERKAGVSEDAIKQRGEHSKAVIELRRAIAEQKKDTADTNAEERERHNRAVEEAKAKEGDLRGKAYGMKAEKVTLDKGTATGMKAEKSSFIKPPSGYRWAENGDLEAIPGGPAAKGQSVTMKAEREKALKEKESAIAQYNRELEQGKITQEQHDEAIAKLTKQGKGGTANTEVGAQKQLAARGWKFDPENPGALTFIPGGPQDPKVIAEQAKARSAGRDHKQTNASPAGATYAGAQLHAEEFLAEIEKSDPRYANTLRGLLKGEVHIQDLQLKRGQALQIIEDLRQIKGDFSIEGKKGAAMKGGSFPPGVAENIAKRVWAGDRQATIGWARNPQMHAELERAIMEEGRKQGKNPKDLVAAMVNLEGERSGSRTLGTRTANVEVAINELKEFIPIAQSASDKVPRTGFKAINQLMRLGREQWSPEQAAFEAANRSIINAFAQVASRSGNATVHNTQEAEHMLNTAQTPEQYKQVLDQLMREAQGASRATRRSRKELSDEISGKESGPPAGGARASPPSSPTAPAGGTGPKRDKPITATNPKTGERLMLKDGQWVPLQ